MIPTLKYKSNINYVYRSDGLIFHGKIRTDDNRKLIKTKMALTRMLTAKRLSGSLRAYHEELSYPGFGNSYGQYVQGMPVNVEIFHGGYYDGN